MPDFETLLTRLLEHHVDFVIVGGFAAVAHGSSLLTQDVDICCRLTPDNLMRLQEALADLHPVHRMTPKRLPLQLTPQTCEGLKNLYLDTDLGQLDCLGTITGVGDFEQARAQSIEIALPAGPCRILSLDALIAAKTAMGRPSPNFSQDFGFERSWCPAAAFSVPFVLDVFQYASGQPGPAALHPATIPRSKQTVVIRRYQYSL
jgi:hypothetical protein